jgi:hypothetical protein
MCSTLHLKPILDTVHESKSLFPVQDNSALNVSQFHKIKFNTAIMSGTGTDVVQGISTNSAVSCTLELFSVCKVFKEGKLISFPSLELLT